MVNNGNRRKGRYLKPETDAGKDGSDSSMHEGIGGTLGGPLGGLGGLKGVASKMSEVIRLSGEMNAKKLPIERVEPNPNNRGGTVTVKKDDIISIRDELDMESLQSDAFGEDKDIKEKIQEVCATKGFSEVQLEFLCEVVDLALSIKKGGLINPITVCNHPTTVGRFMILAGERRFLATVLIGQDSIEAMVKDELDSVFTMCVENDKRSGLSLWDRINIVRMMSKEQKLSINQVVDKTGWSRPTAQRVLKVAEVGDQLLDDFIADGSIANSAVAYELAAIVNESTRRQRIFEEVSKVAEKSPSDKDVVVVESASKKRSDSVDQLTGYVSISVPKQLQADSASNYIADLILKGPEFSPDVKEAAQSILEGKANSRKKLKQLVPLLIRALCGDS
jgi:ParB/RepB/Spo0J family partition protein